jgi:nucleotide-binding universal stress UspA family protein
MRILLATDGSSHSRRATRWLRDLALPSDTKITVLTVAILDEPPRDAQTVSALRATAGNNARRIGERAAQTLERRWHHVEVMVVEGDPRVEIIHAAQEMRAGMIVLGARGLGRIKRFLIGSTSLAAARYAPCPVAIVRGRPHKIGRVLVAVDESDGSRAAVRFLSIAELERDSRVTLLHVLPRTGAEASRSARSSDDRHRSEDERKQQAGAETLLREVGATLEESRRSIERLVTHGDPAREIVKIARSRDVDLVVLGARGLRTLGRLLLGSVSEAVLHQADRPVIIVREDDGAIR